MNIDAIAWVPWIPLLGAVLCGLCCTKPALQKLAGWLSFASIAAAFVLTLLAYLNWNGTPTEATAFNWIEVGAFRAGFSYWLDGLTFLMLFVVTGIGALIAMYAVGYMAGDRGYARFFAGVSLFIFAMTTLVMADNLVLLYLGWEGVGLCSYLLIGHYYERDEAVQASKKAFIVNRIGDLGFALGIFLTFLAYANVHIPTVNGFAAEGGSSLDWANTWIPFLLMLGAFGKSAQIPLHVWLPDAMAGPTPVSALVHAATMVTAGVYMIARLFPLFDLSPMALPTVALIGGVTAIFAATIALCQYDLKKVFAYSTVSQLGYMFMGVGAASTVGGVYHLFTHAFFKALLFLTAGSVMHALAGQLDLRKMSGLRKRMPVTAILMLVGCLALAGFPLTSGFFSKDRILADTMARGLGDHGEPLYFVLAILGVVTAFLTAFYTFRLWCRVFLGEERYEMGDEHHGAADAEADAVAHDPHHAHAPHEMPLFPMNLPLIVLAVGSLGAWLLATGDNGGWVESSINNSSANVAALHEAGADAEHHGPGLMGMDVHLAMLVISSVASVLGIALAFYFHALNRGAAEAIASRFRPVVNTLYHAYFVNNLYNAAIVTPLRLAAYLFFVIDRLVIDALVWVVGQVPRLLGYTIRPMQHGKLQGYGLAMVAGVAFVAALVVFATLPR